MAPKVCARVGDNGHPQRLKLAGQARISVRRTTMNLKKNLSTVQLLTLGLLVSLCWAGVANAAPLYRGRLSLLYEVHWGHAVLPAGEYLLRFVDVQTRVFAVIQDAKTGKDITYLAAVTNGEAKGTSALLITEVGNQQVVHSLRLAELVEVFIYEPALARGAEDVREAHKVQTLPIVAVKR